MRNFREIVILGLFSFSCLYLANAQGFGFVALQSESNFAKNYKFDAKWPWQDGEWGERLLLPALNLKLLLEAGGSPDGIIGHSIILGLAHTSYGLTIANDSEIRNRALGFGIPLGYKLSFFNYAQDARFTISLNYQPTWNYFYRGIEYQASEELREYGFFRDEINKFTHAFSLKVGGGAHDGERYSEMFLKFTYMPQGILNRKFTKNTVSGILLRPFENSPESVFILALGVGL